MTSFALSRNALPDRTIQYTQRPGIRQISHQRAQPDDANVYNMQPSLPIEIPKCGRPAQKPCRRFGSTPLINCKFKIQAGFVAAHEQSISTSSRLCKNEASPKSIAASIPQLIIRLCPWWLPLLPTPNPGMD
jgi:hypothetical protein